MVDVEVFELDDRRQPGRRDLSSIRPHDHSRPLASARNRPAEQQEAQDRPLRRTVSAAPFIRQPSQYFPTADRSVRPARVRQRRRERTGPLMTVEILGRTRTISAQQELV